MITLMICLGFEEDDEQWVRICCSTRVVDFLRFSMLAAKSRCLC